MEFLYLKKRSYQKNALCVEGYTLNWIQIIKKQGVTVRTILPVSVRNAQGYRGLNSKKENRRKLTMRFQGTTQEAGGKFLGADFWKKGVRIEGRVFGSFDTENGTSYNVHLKKPVKIDGEETDRVAIGALKGFGMALRASGAEELQVNDLIVLECTGTTPTNKGNDQIDFKLLVDRK